MDSHIQQHLEQALSEAQEQYERTRQAMRRMKWGCNVATESWAEPISVLYWDTYHHARSYWGQRVSTFRRMLGQLDRV